ncbi:MAG: glycerate kinase type-2 family protein [Gammaproteobacteria bacterium]
MTDLLTGMRRDALTIFYSGIQSAEPGRAVKKCISLQENNIELLLDIEHPERKRIGKWRKVHVISFGKAACAMAKAVREIVPADFFHDRGIAVTNYENVTPIDGFEVFGAGHPLPDQSGVRAATAVAESIERAERGELVLVLISGGGSALIPCPADGITLEEKIITTGLLLSSGATINEINCVRKHLSKLKGGGLTRLAAPADLHAMILSDVLGDDLSSIASGPTVPDKTTFQDAIEVLKNHNIWGRVPDAVRTHLVRGSQNDRPETPKTGDPVFAGESHCLIGSNAISVKAILSTAGQLGYECILYSDNLSGEARAVAENLLLYAKKILERDPDKPLAVLAGGETTVTLKGSGKGGRNQEMALSFALAAKEHELGCRWVFLSGGTDGRDGPTDAAGGMVDAESVKRMRETGIDPLALLDRNDSYVALNHSHDLLMTGPTGTNVADLQILLLRPHNASNF